MSNLPWFRLWVNKLNIIWKYTGILGPENNFSYKEIYFGKRIAVMEYNLY